MFWPHIYLTATLTRPNSNQTSGFALGRNECGKFLLNVYSFTCKIQEEKINSFFLLSEMQNTAKDYVAKLSVV